MTLGLVAALLAGPTWQPARPRKPYSVLATLPLVGLVLGACTLAATLLPVPLSLADAVLHRVPAAAAGTLLCLTAAIPAATFRPGLAWLLPAWLAVSIGVAGLSLIAVSQTPLTRAMQTAILLLPFMVLSLAGAGSGAPQSLSRAAAAAGAGPLATACLLTRVAWPGAWRVLLVIFAMGVAVQ